MDYAALVAGLVGALIGASSSLLGQALQNRYQNRRETTRLLYETAYKDYELRILNSAQNVGPFPVILDYHQRMMQLTLGGTLTPEATEELFVEQARMMEAVNKAILRVNAAPPPPEERADPGQDDGSASAT